MPLNSHTTAISKILEESAASIMDVYRSSDYSVRHKDDLSPVTRADTLAETIIKRGLDDLTPGIPVIGEESVSDPDANDLLPDDYWIVDPLDGTREFIKGNGEFCTCLARITGGEVTEGYIYSPTTSSFWWAIRGKGAFSIIDGAEYHLPAAGNSGALRILKSRSHSGPGEAGWISMISRIHDISEEFQGSAIKFARIAEGSGDIYIKFGMINKWDVAAGALLAEESGGGIYALESARPLSFKSHGYRVEPFMAFSHRVKDPVKLIRYRPPF